AHAPQCPRSAFGMGGGGLFQTHARRSRVLARPIMRIAVTHSTAYRYDSPVYHEPHTFRLRPREDGAQHLVRYHLEISPPPAGRTECLDQDGNVVVEA